MPFFLTLFLLISLSRLCVILPVMCIMCPLYTAVSLSLSLSLSSYLLLMCHVLVFLSLSLPSITVYFCTSLCMMCYLSLSLSSDLFNCIMGHCIFPPSLHYSKIYFYIVLCAWQVTSIPLSPSPLMVIIFYTNILHDLKYRLHALPSYLFILAT